MDREDVWQPHQDLLFESSGSVAKPHVQQVSQARIASYPSQNQLKTCFQFTRIAMTLKHCVFEIVVSSHQPCSFFLLFSSDDL